MAERGCPNCAKLQAQVTCWQRRWRYMREYLRKAMRDWRGYHYGDKAEFLMDKAIHEIRPKVEK